MVPCECISAKRVREDWPRAARSRPDVGKDIISRLGRARTPDRRFLTQGCRDARTRGRSWVTVACRLRNRSRAATVAFRSAKVALLSRSQRRLSGPRAAVSEEARDTFVVLPGASTDLRGVGRVDLWEASYGVHHCRNTRRQSHSRDARRELLSCAYLGSLDGIHVDHTSTVMRGALAARLASNDRPNGFSALWPLVGSRIATSWNTDRVLSCQTRQLNRSFFAAHGGRSGGRAIGEFWLADGLLRSPSRVRFPH